MLLSAASVDITLQSVFAQKALCRKPVKKISTIDELSGRLESFSSIHALLHQWYQPKVWKEGADDAFNRSLCKRIPNAPTWNLGIPMDVLITRGSISVDFMANQSVCTTHVVPTS